MFHSGGIIVAFLLISYAHVVIGEVVPKNMALEKADRLALLVAPPLLVFGRPPPPLLFLSRSGRRGALSKLIGLSGDQSGGGHSTEELKFVVSLSHEEGHLRRFEEDAILALLDLKDYYVREIMVPRNQIISISLEANLDQVLQLMSANEFSRLPVYEKSPENIVGYIHYKDLLDVWEKRRVAQEKRKLPRAFRVRHILRRLPIVPETKVLADLIDEFRDTHRHMALVVDEFGTIAGLVTLEDILEQIFGEIGDEHDAKRPAHKAETPVVELDGSTSIRDLDAQYGIELPGDAGFETLAGFIALRIGLHPERGRRSNLWRPALRSDGAGAQSHCHGPDRKDRSRTGECRCVYNRLSVPRHTVFALQWSCAARLVAAGNRSALALDATRNGPDYPVRPGTNLHGVVGDPIQPRPRRVRLANWSAAIFPEPVSSAGRMDSFSGVRFVYRSVGSAGCDPAAYSHGRGLAVPVFDLPVRTLGPAQLFRSSEHSVTGRGSARMTSTEYRLNPVKSCTRPRDLS